MYTSLLPTLAMTIEAASGYWYICTIHPGIDQYFCTILVVLSRLCKKKPHFEAFSSYFKSLSLVE